jgi:hypothetical protein
MLAMDSVLPERTRSACKRLDLISGQHECYPVGKEWTCFGHSKESLHMDIRYFFIADRAKSDELRIEYCPTEEMLGDFFTKPLQGGQFYILRDDIMNVDPRSKYHSAHRSVLSHESHDDEPGTRGCDDDVTSTDVATNGDVCKRRSYLEVLMQ